jgi:hypothetical protein
MGRWYINSYFDIMSIYWENNMKIALVEDSKEYSTLLINALVNRNIGINIECFEDNSMF